MTIFLCLCSDELFDHDFIFWTYTTVYCKSEELFELICMTKWLVYRDAKDFYNVNWCHGGYCQDFCYCVRRCFKKIENWWNVLLIQGYAEHSVGHSVSLFLCRDFVGSVHSDLIKFLPLESVLCCIWFSIVLKFVKFADTCALLKLHWCLHISCHWTRWFLCFKFWTFVMPLTVQCTTDI